MEGLQSMQYRGANCGGFWEADGRRKRGECPWPKCISSAEGERSTLKEQKNKRGKRDDTYVTENVHGGVVDGEKIKEEVRRQ